MQIGTRMLWPPRRHAARHPEAAGTGRHRCSAVVPDPGVAGGGRPGTGTVAGDRRVPGGGGRDTSRPPVPGGRRQTPPGGPVGRPSRATLAGAADRPGSGGLLLDHDQRRVSVDGAEVPLTFQEFELLAFLAALPATVFSRADLVRAVWQRDFAADSRTVDVYVSATKAQARPGATASAWSPSTASATSSGAAPGDPCAVRLQPLTFGRCPW